MNQLDSASASSSESRPSVTEPLLSLDCNDASNVSDESDVECGESDDDADVDCNIWGDSLKHFDKLTQMCSNLPVVDNSLNSNDSPLKYFEAFLDDDLCSTIVIETNRYHAQKLAVKGQTLITENELTTEDLKAWISVLVLMGIHQLPELQNYWSADPLLAVPAVKEVMTSKKYKKIVETVHCNDNSTAIP